MSQQVSASLSKAQLQLQGHALTIAHLFGMRVVWLLKISFVPVQASTNGRTCIVGCHCQYMHGRQPCCLKGRNAMCSQHRWLGCRTVPLWLKPTNASTRVPEPMLGGPEPMLHHHQCDLRSGKGNVQLANGELVAASKQFTKPTNVVHAPHTLAPSCTSTATVHVQSVTMMATMKTRSCLRTFTLYATMSSGRIH